MVDKEMMSIGCIQWCRKHIGQVKGKPSEEMERLCDTALAYHDVVKKLQKYQEMYGPKDPHPNDWMHGPY